MSLSCTIKYYAATVYQVQESRCLRMDCLNEPNLLTLTNRSSLVVDRLSNSIAGEKVAVAYYYFDFRDQECQSADGMLSSLLKQLSVPTSVLPHPVLELYQNSTRQQRQPRHEDLEEVLLLTCRTFDRVFVVIDALDECCEDERKAVLRSLDMLHKGSCCSIFVTSRPHPEDIKKAFELFPKIDIEATASNLKKYVQREIESKENLDEIDELFKDEIVEKISHGAGHMYDIPSFFLDNTALTSPPSILLRLRI